jgi:hypothetical protein
MRIEAIQTSNFIGARAIDVRLHKPVALFAGKNGAGKSSVQEAVRMALTGETVRVDLKKHYGQLVSDGAEAGFAVVDYDGQRAAMTLPNGAHEVTGGPLPPALPFVLDVQSFARLPDDERRAFLFGLMGLRTDGPAVKERLTARGISMAKIEQTMPFLRSGFDSAMKEAQGKAREAKGSWKTVTGGETYGSVKAAAWVAPKPAYDQKQADGLSARLDDIGAAIEQGSADLGGMQADLRRHNEAAGRLSELREQAGKIERIKAKLATDEASLAEWQQKVADTRAKADGTKADTCACPECGAALLWRNGELLQRAVEKTADPEAIASLPEYERALKLCESAVANGKRDLQAAEAAVAAVAELEASLGEAPDEGKIAGMQSRLQALKQERTDLVAQASAINSAGAKAKEADERTAQAAALHKDVAEWEQIADALAPEGIRAEMLAEALGPINDRMHATCEIAEWPKVTLQSDMRVTMGLRGYALLSESEKWRVDAVIGEAISFLSGIRLLVLDRFDVLDLKGREDALYLLDCLTADGQLDSALLFGTLKGLPSQLPQNIEAFWIENGVTGKMEAAA